MDSINREQSIAVAKEVFREIGVTEVIDCISFPESGSWKAETLSFQPCKLTDTIRKRPETASFPVFARIDRKHLTGETICEFSDGTSAVSLDDGTLKFRFNPFATHLANLNEWYQSSEMGSLRRLALSLYWLIPPQLRRGLRWIGRQYKTSDIRSLKDLGLLGISSNVIIHLIEKHLIERGFLGELSKSPLAVVTHDIDTDFCQKEGREIVSTVENREGVHATWFFVPQSVEYCLDKGGVQELTEEGHEIGMHGFAHDGKLALDNPAKLTRQLKKGKSVLESVGAKVASFRSPWTLRSSILLQTLASVGFVVDSSFPDVDTLGMTSGRPGLSYNRPFRPLIVKDESLVEPLTLWEVPMTSPQDVQMIEDLKLTGDNLLKVWIYKAKFCMDFGGVFVLHTHPVHIVNHLDEYARILKLLKATGFRLLRMEDLASELQPSLLEQTGLQSLNQKDQTTPKEFSS